MSNTTLNMQKSDIEKQLEAEAALAKYRKTIAEANEAEAKADKQRIDSINAALEAERNKWKAPETKALEGKITSTGNFIETQILANECLSTLTDELVKEILKNESFKTKELNFVFYNAADFPSIELCLSFLDHLKILKNILKQAIEQGENSLKQDKSDTAGGLSPLMIGFTASGILRTTADIFSLFKQNTTITNSDIALEETLIISAFTSKLKEKNNNCRVYYPAGYPVYMIETPDNSSSEFIQLFNTVKNSAIEASLLQKKIEDELIEIDAQLMTIVDPSLKHQFENRKMKLTNGLSPLQNATSEFSHAEMALSTIDANTKLSIRAMVLRAEKLIMLLEQENTYIIKLSAKLNGSTRIKEGLFQMTKAMHSGGAQLNCLIFSKDGSILFSNNQYSYTAYKEPTEISSHK